jgi:hypothetical protein
MNLALELFLSAVGMITAIVVIAEVLYNMQNFIGKRD